MEQCGDTHIWSTSDGQVHANAGGRPVSLLAHVNDAAVIAYDWLGNYIYWSNSKYNSVRSDHVHLSHLVPCLILSFLVWVDPAGSFKLAELCCRMGQGQCRDCP